MFSNEMAAHATNALAGHAFIEFIKSKFPQRFAFLIENQHVTQKPDYKSAYEKLVNETETCTDC